MMDGRRRVLFVVAGSLCVAVGVAFAILATSWPGRDKPRPDNAQAASLVRLQPTVVEASTVPPPTATSTKTRPPASTNQPHAVKPGHSSTPTTKAKKTTAKPTATSATSTPGPTTQKTVEIAGAEAVVSGPVLIRNQTTGYCVDLGNYGAAESASRVTQWNCNAADADNQEYEELKIGDQYLLRNVKSQLCLDIPGYDATAAGGEVLIYDCVPGDSDNLMFRLVADGSGSQIVNAKSNLCLDVSTENGATSAPDQPLTLSACGSSATQIWKLE
jgi:hypothetical protein